MAQTYNKILTKGYYSALGTTPTEDGKLRFTVDTGQLFLDNQNERIEITDFVKGQTEEEIRATLAPLPKFYYASDTKRFLVYVDGEWEIVAEKNSDTVQNASSATYAQNANLAEEATHAVDADHATNADTATYANDAGNAENANHASNADNATNASSATYATNAGNAENADHATNADNADEAAHATTADNATNAATATYAKNAGTAAQATNATNAATATYAKNAGTATRATNANHATNADNADEAAHATNAATATYAKNAGTATRATNANHATNADNADEAAHATNADTATYAKNAGTATRATNANHATEADNADYATNAGTATRATADGNGRNIVSTYAPLNSPIFSGTPTAPTAASGSSSTQIANTAFVTRAVAEAIGGVTQFQIAIYDTFEDLPGTGTAGTIYFVKNNSEEENNAYDEYIWTGSAYELMGTVKIDLSNYVNAVDISGTGNAVTGMQKSGNKLTLTKSATFLTQHPSVSKNSSTFAERPAAGSTMSVVDNVTVDNYGHLTNYRRKTVTLPNSVDNADHATNADTATYARNAGSSTNARNASSADFADNAGTATRATGDSAGDNIRNTYIKSASVSGRTVTFTKGNGSTFSITTQDNNTTYANMRGATGTAGGAAGLVPAPASGNNDDFLRGDGTWAKPAAATNADTATYARNAGTATRASTATYAVNAGTATKATGDSAGDNIRSTYIKNASVSGRTVTFTKGNGSTFSITTQDNNTTYANMRGATSAVAGGAGLVPAPAAGNHDDFLRGDGKWAIPAKATNADTATYAKNAGSATNARNASSADYANNAGTATRATGDSSGDNIRNTYIKNASVNGRTVTFTKGNGSTFSITTQDNNTTYANMRGATGTAGGAAGLVPAPAAGNHDDFLRGDGKWAIPAKATNADTATYAKNAGTASRASTATYAVNAGTATRATGDSAGDNIRSTYIKNASVNGRTVTFTKGNGSTFSITTQDNNTTYSAMRGATSAVAGGAGLVPAPAAGNHDDFLRGDGKWAIPAKATNADTATYAKNAGSATNARNASSATNAATATYARNAGTAATTRGFLDVDFDFGDLDE